MQLVARGDRALFKRLCEVAHRHVEHTTGGRRPFRWHASGRAQLLCPPLIQPRPRAVQDRTRRNFCGHFFMYLPLCRLFRSKTSSHRSRWRPPCANRAPAAAAPPRPRLRHWRRHCRPRASVRQGLARPRPPTVAWRACTRARSPLTICITKREELIGSRSLLHLLHKVHRRPRCRSRFLALSLLYIATVIALHCITAGRRVQLGLPTVAFSRAPLETQR